jgi:hypothetical protein
MVYTKGGWLQVKIFLYLLIPLVLAGFTHTWNPIGFPHGPVNDEGIYLRRAMNVIEGHGPQEFSPLYYDHPYFSQIFVASILEVIGYPESLHPIADDVRSIESLYLVPRILMGVFAIIDTFLIYKIAEFRYNNRNIAFAASILFAVMPVTFPTRWVLLESIQLPFLLFSILLVTRKSQWQQQKQTHFSNLKEKGKQSVVTTLISGIFLGLSIFTKIPTFTMIPLVAFLIITNSNSNSRWKLLGLWLVPVITIPLIWPVYATFSLGQFDEWWEGIYLQTHRTDNNTFFLSVDYNFKIDHVFVILGIMGLVFAAVKREIFILLWVIPFIVFLYGIRFVSFYHFIPIIPALCIAAAVLIINLSGKITRYKFKHKIIFISAIVIFGFSNTIAMIITSNNSLYFEALSFIIQYLQDTEDNGNGGYQRVSIVSNPFYLWIPKYVFDLDNDYIGYYDSKMPIKNDKVLAVLDQGFIDGLKNNQAGEQIQKINKYSSHTISKIATFAKQPNQTDYVYIYEYRLN